MVFLNLTFAAHVTYLNFVVDAKFKNGAHDEPVQDGKTSLVNKSNDDLKKKKKVCCCNLSIALELQTDEKISFKR